MSEYEPVSCELHSQLEWHVMHQRPLRMHWNESPDVNHKLTVVPIDLYTPDGQEFLKIRDDQGQTRVIRLDRILDFSPVD